VSIAEGLSERGHRVSVLADFEHVDASIELDPSVTRYVLPSSQQERATARHIVTTVRAVRAFIRTEWPDVIVGFDRITSIASRTGVVGSRTEVVLAERTNPFAVAHSARQRVAMSLYYSGKPKVVVQTIALASDLGRKYQGIRAFVVPNFLPSRRLIEMDATLERAGPRQKTVLFVGRLSEAKGALLLLDAFRESGVANSGWSLRYVGSGPVQGDLRARVVEYGLGSLVEVRPPTTTPEDEYALAGMLVVPSSFEGFSNVLMEGLSMGVPAIALDFAYSSRELVNDGENGLVVARAEGPSGLARAIARLGSDDDLRAKLGRAARQDRTRFEESRILGLWEDVLSSVAGR
jgi:glycosyltransferase involved in cell wall biosynthesis